MWWTTQHRQLQKSKTNTATCVLCGGDHPVNYKGCDYYQKHYHAKHANNRPPVAQRYTSHFTPQQSVIPGPQGRTYAQALCGERPMPATPNVEEPMSVTQFLGEFKVMFNQLIQQNSMVLNMLTMLLNKLNIG